MLYRSVPLFSAILVLTALCSQRATAQTVATNSLSAQAYCLGDTVTVSYTAAGSFGAKNAFTIQLSDPSGSFANGFQNIGSLRSTTSGSIRAWIGSTVQAGSHYRLRVNASDPYTVGTDNGSDIQLSAHPDPGFSITPEQRIVLAGNSATFTAWDRDPKDTHSWTFNQGSTSWTMSGAEVTPVFENAGVYSVRHSVTNATGCESVWDSTNRDGTRATIIQTYSCTPQIPSSAIIDSVDTLSFPANNVVWVVPGGTFTPAYDNCTVYVEPGGTVHHTRAGWRMVVYLKDGASLIGDGFSYVTVIHSAGAGITGLLQESPILECPNLSFDYSVAPPYKIRPAGVSSPSASVSLEVYPNPASRVLHLEAAVAPQYIAIRDVSGAKVLSFDRDLSAKMDLGIDALANGVYFVEITTDRETLTRSIVITK